MKILLVSSYLPYPLLSGGQVRLYNLIKELSARHEITLICEKRPNQSEQDVAAVSNICKNVITVARRKQWSLGNIVQAAFSSHSFLVIGHTNKQMQEKINLVMAKEKFDLIHVETFYVMQNVCENDDKKIPLVLVEHNIEYLVYKRFMNRAPMAIRPFLQLDIAKIRHEEEHSWKRADALVSVSQEDKKVMDQSGYASSLVSNGVNIDEFAMKNVDRAFLQKEKKVLFIGDFTWIQNQDAAKFIIQDIWPKLRSRLPQATDNVKLWIVARNIPDSIRQLSNDPTILFDEKSSSRTTPSLFQEAYATLTPIRVGGGSSYKILESMACGTPVITMQMSADAINAKDGHEILVGKNEEELAEKTVLLLQDKSLYERLSKNGRKLIENSYSWKEISKNLDQVYQSILKAS